MLSWPMATDRVLPSYQSSDFTQVVYSYQPQVLGTIDIQPQNLSAVKAGMLTLPNWR